MITCPACGKENEDSAYECKRCRAPLREEIPEEHPAEEAAPAAPESESLGEVCRRCETYNEPGVRVCTNCGLELFAEPAPEEPVMQATPESSETNQSITAEMRALALSDDEAAEAGLAHGNGTPEPAMDTTPPDAYQPQHEEPPPPPPPPARPVATAGGGVGIAARRAPEPPPAPAKAPEPVSAEKACPNCGAMNPPAAKFCFDCGTPFAKKPAPPPEPPPTPKVEPVKRPSIEISPSIQVDAELAEATAESAPVSLDEPLPEDQTAEEPFAEEVPEEPVAAESVAEPIEEEPPPPFQASLIVEKGGSQGTAFALAHLENKIGGNGAQIELAEDPFVAPHAATIAFAEDHLVVRDEGTANGVFVKVRESAPLEPGDFFAAGERLFRYDGPTELPKNGQDDTPFLGAPRPQGKTVRVTEMLAGGKTGRTCHRSGPAIAIGRTGCDMNFPSDQLLAARHAEIRLAEDGSATLVDLGAGPSGVFVRVRMQGQHDLQAGDVLQIGEQLLRVEVG